MPFANLAVRKTIRSRVTTKSHNETSQGTFMTPNNTRKSALVATLALAAALLAGCDKPAGSPPMPSASSAASTPG